VTSIKAIGLLFVVALIGFGPGRAHAELPADHSVTYVYDATVSATSVAATAGVSPFHRYDERSHWLRGRMRSSAGVLATKGTRSAGALSRGAASKLTSSQATDLAEWLGFQSTGQRLRGQPIFDELGEVAAWVSRPVAPAVGGDDELGEG